MSKISDFRPEYVQQFAFIIKHVLCIIALFFIKSFFGTIVVQRGIILVEIVSRGAL